jgi:hypothetical protein
VKIIAFDPFKHLEYVRSVLMVPISNSTRGLVAIDKHWQPQGIVILDNWAENSVMGHIAIQHPMAMRELPFKALEHVFNTCQKGMFIGMIPSDNPKSMNFHLHLGFKKIYCLKDGYAKGIDYNMVQLLKEDCRYIKQMKEVA